MKKIKALPNKPPEYLQKEASDTWKKIVPVLKSRPQVNDLDAELVEMYCANYELFRAAYDDVRKNGIQKPVYKVTVSPIDGSKVAREFAGYKKNPSVEIMNKASAKVQSLGSELGLSPKSRDELNKIKPVKAKKKSSMADFMKGA